MRVVQVNAQAQVAARHVSHHRADAPTQAREVARAAASGCNHLPARCHRHASIRACNPRSVEQTRAREGLDMVGSGSAATVRIRPAQRRRPILPTTRAEFLRHKSILAGSPPFFERPQLAGPRGLVATQFSMSSLAWLPLWLVVAWLGGCAKGDVNLGERGAVPAPGTPADIGVVAEAAPEPDDAAAADPRVPTGAAAGSGSSNEPEAMDAGVTALDAAAPSQDNDADSGSPNPVARPSAGCDRAPTTVETIVDVDGMRADFLLDMPTSYDPARAYALVLAFRGVDQSAAEFRSQLQLATVMGADAIVVHANPLSNGTTWEFQRDIPMVDALVSTLGAAFCVDQDRVFAMGAGAGALFVNLVGCVRANKVRGIAVLSNAPPPPGPCLDNTAVWLLNRTDTDPMTVGAGLGNRDFWAARNSCNVLMPMPSTAAACVEYAGCRDRLPVQFCEHAGDELPSFAVSMAWDFFRSL